MHRRDFLRFAGLASSGLAFPSLVPSAFAQDEFPTPWRVFEVTTRVHVLKPKGVTRVWLPTPLTRDTPYLKTLGNEYEAEGVVAKFAVDPKYGAGIVWAEWPEGAQPVLRLKSRFAARDIRVDLAKPGNPRPEDPAVLAKFTQPTDLLPTDGIVKETSSSIVKGARTDLEKARAIYEWVVDNTFRDPDTRGCGTGDVKFMLENGIFGGKCADLNGLFVALARAEGIPARDVYGVRVAASRLGFLSLGMSGDITKAQHCRAEVHLHDYGWVPVDPADVRKVILEEGGGKDPRDPVVLAVRKRLFGSWEMNYLAYNYAADLALPHSAHGKVGFLMYPQCDTARSRLDPLDPDDFRYRITARELA